MARYNGLRWCVGIALGIPLCFAQARGPSQPACKACHQRLDRTVQASAHAAAGGCESCHSDHERYPHPKGVVKPSCRQCHETEASQHARSVHGRALSSGNAAAPDCSGCHGDAHQTANARSAEFRKAVPETCGACHDAIAREFGASVHGRALASGISAAAACTDCHGEHAIERPQSARSPVYKANIRETCAQCHGNVRLSSRFGFPSDRLVSFDESFHGLAAKAGSQTVANCASCHGVHNILPSSDPKSTIHPRRLRETCGKCHKGAGTRFAALGPVHVWPGRTEPAAVRFVRQAYLILIPVLVGLMLLHNLGDAVRKFRRLRMGPSPAVRNGPPAYAPVRMYRFERAQHLCLLVSFITLAWTGFLLKYPGQWWARPVIALEGDWTVRGIVHRAAAIVFLIAGAMHIGSLITEPRLRDHWKRLWPRLDDVREAALAFAYNLGLTSWRPHVSTYSYIEKAEYWAVLWGGVVMTATGVLLWANNLALSWLPKQVLDVATALHFYEAVLACLAILVWHFYVVIFDPDVYPMDTTWITGRSVREHMPDAAGELLGECPPEEAVRVKATK